MHPLAVVLVHHPVKDKVGDMIATNITNLDIHDIARVARVYGVEKYFIVHPRMDQLTFVHRILDHWRVGYGASYNSKRKMALEPVETAKSLGEVKRVFYPEAVFIATSASKSDTGVTYSEIRELLKNQPVVLVFGTGYGLHEDLLAECDGILEPIVGASEDDYRHLSVRSAVSISLDRVCRP